MGVAVKAVFIGMVVLLAGTIPRNLIFAANLRYYASVPWAVPVTAVYLWFFWQYLKGAGPPQSTALERAESLRANRVARSLCIRISICGCTARRSGSLRQPLRD